MSAKKAGTYGEEIVAYGAKREKPRRAEIRGSRNGGGGSAGSRKRRKHVQRNRHGTRCSLWRRAELAKARWLALAAAAGSLWRKCGGGVAKLSVAVAVSAAKRNNCR